ncbi:uncharacterized protein BO66DRAFT_403745 [Aspergillus aculeatinus CBS 121060]|uniref:Uncharacterized protein n=1 Tax=Aspergillus aculeatinus CBS 121060 TaxID=1448322 RepID=A0ACD1H1X6_9EURO|nr:hypothetical protein BO66DRAFT_403745 [Aspergillus aculeatinus CBS 121060]RAH67553.1 hypothetical protein BO66DRAFT_403745 [Aspergillus aculeatinus CBS 121060]
MEEDASAAIPIYRWEGRGLGVCFENVTVVGAAQGNRRVNDFGSILLKVAMVPITLVKGILLSEETRERRILQDLTGALFPGETLLVLGNPGAGCSTALKVHASHRAGYQRIDGSVRYAGLSPEDFQGEFRFEVVYNDEEDIHFPSLSVQDTMEFALRLRWPAGDPQQPHERQFTRTMTERLLAKLGMSHTRDTIVDDAFIRGVSGGERKRVSLAEVLAVNPSVASWDNPIRGLDSSSAQDFLFTLKEMSKSTGMTNIVSLYQASEMMYQTCFSKVLLLYEGRAIYFGPASQARKYFHDMGFLPLHRQSTPEFLLGVTSPNERRIDPRCSNSLSADPDSLAKTYRSSEIYRHVVDEIAHYKAHVCTSGVIEAFHAAVESTVSKHRWLKASGPSTMLKQVLVASQRHFRLLWSDKATVYTVTALTIVNALICGSAFYHAPRTSTGSFMRSCALYFPLVYFFLNSLTEVSKTVHARSILLKQFRLGFIHPASFAITQALCDIPLAFILTLIFSCCYYFLVGFNETASQFWIFVLITFAHYGSVSAMFRMLGAWSPDMSIALLAMGAAIPVVTLYAGYAPPLPTQHRWGSWLRRVAPTPYALEALLSNEFYNIQLHCTESELVPSGPGYENLAYQGCPLPDAKPGTTVSSGSVYLHTYYEYSREHLWRNFGIIIAFWFIYVVLTAVGLTLLTRETNQASGLVFKRGCASSSAPTCTITTTSTTTTPATSKESEEPRSLDVKCSRGSDKAAGVVPPTDEDHQPPFSEPKGSGEEECDVRSLLTFENLSYTVTVNNKPKRLLNNISGYVRAGQLTALMGASGAGKTTLLDILSQRKVEGQVDGTMLMDGRPIDGMFARSCGFCMQQDIHEPLTTLGPIADAIVGEAGDGKLGVEERKRLTIGVELAARPLGLLFLDEPTSGLDSQAAYSVISFLRCIAAEGIPIICTIHQSFGVIFDMFDHILLLAPGGNTVYFGETGPNLQILAQYFAQYGLTMAADENPAEFVVKTITDKSPRGRDWAQIWAQSEAAG